VAHALLSSAEHDELRAMVQQALDMAQRVDDPVVLCDPLRISGQIDSRPETTDIRLAIVEEMIATAERIGDLDRLADVYDMYIYDQLELGNIDAADAAIAQQKWVAEGMRQPFQLHVAKAFKMMRALLNAMHTRRQQSAASWGSPRWTLSWVLTCSQFRRNRDDCTRLRPL
jgi:hypothetical protein